MTAADKVNAYRLTNALTLEELAELCECSPSILMYVKSGRPIHPNIAHRIGRVCRLTTLEIEELMPENRRRNGPNHKSKTKSQLPEYIDDDFIPETSILTNPRLLSARYFGGRKTYERRTT